MSTSGALDLYVIYRNPLDYPGKFVVRVQVATAQGNALVAAEPLAVVDSLPAARMAVPWGLANIGRMADDDPQIVEVWI